MASLRALSFSPTVVNILAQVKAAFEFWRRLPRRSLQDAPADAAHLSRRSIQRPAAPLKSPGARAAPQTQKAP